jgi:hypothetical protein
MRPRRLLTCALIVLVVLTPSLSLAQDLRIEERPRPDAPQGGPPGRESSAPPASGVPARDVQVEHAPAFIEPFVYTYETPTAAGQFGLSGWTAPNPPVGPPLRDVPGWLSFGFTLTWGARPTSATP